MRNEILDVDPSETVDLEVKRHPIGQVQIIVTGVVVGLLILGLPYFFSTLDTFGFDEQFATGSSILTIISFLLLALVVLSVLIAIRVYNLNELIVTSENLILVNQTSLFSNKISQLSLEKVQDVTGTQKGIIQTLFNYGTIFIETAGEADNFGFRWARDPHIAAKHINEAHERFIKKYGIDVV